MGVGIELQVPHGQRRLAAGWTTAQQGPEPRQQFLALEWLDQVVVGTGIEALDARLHGVASGEHQNRDVVGLAQRLRHLDPVESRKPEIEDHQIRQERVGQIQRAHPVAGDLDLVALHSERPLEHMCDRDVIFDDQHAGRALVIDHCSRRW